MSTPATKTDLFRRLVAERARICAGTFAPAPTLAEALRELDDHLLMLQLNEEDGDTREAMLENLAELTGAAERLRDRLLADVTADALRRVVAEAAADEPEGRAA